MRDTEAGTGIDHDATALVRRYYDRSASQYDGWLRQFDQVMLGNARRRLCSRARGLTLEVAVGTGANLAHYPPDVDLVGIDLSRGMLTVARERARGAGDGVALAQGDAQVLPFPNEVFDTVVATLLLSTVPDDRRAAREIARVLRPGGRFLIVDMTRSPHAPVRFLERSIAPLTMRSRFSMLRDPLDYLEETGFVIEHADRFRLGIVEEVVCRKSGGAR